MITIPVTPEQIEVCRAAHIGALVHAIRDAGQSHPPGDGTIGRIVASLKALDEIHSAVLSIEPETFVAGSTDAGAPVTITRKKERRA